MANCNEIQITQQEKQIVAMDPGLIVETILSCKEQNWPYLHANSKEDTVHIYLSWKAMMYLVCSFKVVLAAADTQTQHISDNRVRCI